MLYTGADGSTSGGGSPASPAMWCAMMGATERMTSLRRTGWAGGSVVATLGTVLVVTTSSTCLGLGSGVRVRVKVRGRIRVKARVG